MFLECRCLVIWDPSSFGIYCQWAEATSCGLFFFCATQILFSLGPPGPLTAHPHSMLNPQLNTAIPCLRAHPQTYGRLPALRRTKTGITAGSSLFLGLWPRQVILLYRVSPLYSLAQWRLFQPQLLRMSPCVCTSNRYIIHVLVPHVANAQI